MRLPPLPFLRRLATICTFAILGVAALWCLLWTVAASEYRHIVDGWLEAERGHGHVVSYDERTTGGFPHAVLLRFTNLSWSDTEGGRVKAGAITFTANPWRWRVFNIAFTDGFEISVPFPSAENPLMVHGEEGDGHVELTDSNNWDFVRLRFTNLEASRPAHKVFTAANLELTADRPEEPAKDHTETGLSLSAKATRVVLTSEKPLPFGVDVPTLDASLRIMGPPPDIFDKASVAAWNTESGVIEWDNFDLAWGPLTLSAKGTLGLDDDLQPEGAFSGKIGGQDDVIRALLDQGWIAKRQANMLNSVLNLFARPGKIAEKPSLEMPIAVQMGGLFLGPVRIFEFPEIEWGK